MGTVVGWAAVGVHGDPPYGPQQLAEVLVSCRLGVVGVEVPVEEGVLPMEFLVGAVPGSGF